MVSDPVTGNRRYSAALEISGVLSGPGPADWSGDKGYIGNGRLTPIRKPRFRDLLEWDPLPDRAGHRESEDLASPSCGLPEAACKVRGHDLRRPRTGVLQDRL
jgi:hypothetical protein